MKYALRTCCLVFEYLEKKDTIVVIKRMRKRLADSVLPLADLALPLADSSCPLPR